jgi:hypothetical protein
MASTPAKQIFTHQVAVTEKTVTPTDYKGKDNRGTAIPGATPHGKGQKNDHSQQCAGLPEVQRLATKFSLSTASQSDDVEAIYSLHDGSFEGTTISGATLSTSTVYGYGEIDQLLTSAQFLASHDKGNVDGKLTSSNTRTYLADALHGCGKTPSQVCQKTNTPATPTANNNGNAGNKQHVGNGKAKPTGTPTPKH